MFKAIGRGFKKVGGFVKNNWKKIGTVALLGSAAFFTFGAALGVTGSWATKVGALVSKVGLKGKLANIVSGAITQAASGGWIGGALGAATGQGFMAGAGTGAAVGAAAGGAMGAFQPAGGGTMASAPNAADSRAMAGGAFAENTASQGIPQGGLMHSAGPQGMMTPGWESSVGGGSAFSRVFNTIFGSGGIGPVIQGVGQGLMAGSAQEQEKAPYDPIRPLMFRQAGDGIIARWGNAPDERSAGTATPVPGT